MDNVMATKLTKGGQTTVPKAIRKALGIGEESRVWWHVEHGRAVVSAEAPIPNAVDSAEDFWDGINLALSDVASSRTRDACLVSDKLRRKYGL